MNTPGGSPHSSAMAANSSADSGVFSSGLRITELPTARAGANFHRLSSSGKFHGAIAPTTPIGSLRSVDWPSTGNVARGMGVSNS